MHALICPVHCRRESGEAGWAEGRPSRWYSVAYKAARTPGPNRYDKFWFCGWSCWRLVTATRPLPLWNGNGSSVREKGSHNWEVDKKRFQNVYWQTSLSFMIHSYDCEGIRSIPLLFHIKYWKSKSWKRWPILVIWSRITRGLKFFPFRIFNSKFKG